MKTLMYLNDETYRVTGSVSPYVPARTYGPPEDCYPEEGGEADVESIEIQMEVGGELEFVVIQDPPEWLTKEAEQALFDQAECDARDMHDEED